MGRTASAGAGVGGSGTIADRVKQQDAALEALLAHHLWLGFFMETW